MISLLFSKYSGGVETKWDFVYVVPFAIFLSMFCYSDSLMKFSFIYSIINGKIPNILTFFSFGLLFVSEYINYKNVVINDRILNMSVITEALNYSNLILEIIIKYRKDLVKNKIIIDSSSEIFLKEIEALCEEKGIKCKTEIDLLDLGKETYSLIDFDEAYTNNNKKLNFSKKKNKN